MCVGGGSGVGRYEEVWRGVERCGEGVLQEKERKKLTVTATTSSNVSPPSPLSASDCDSLDMVYGFTFIQTDPKAFIFFLCGQAYRSIRIIGSRRSVFRDTID